MKVGLNNSFNFQPIFNRRQFNCHRGTDAGPAVFEIRTSSNPKLDDSDRLFLNLLRKRGSRTEKERHDQRIADKGERGRPWPSAVRPTSRIKIAPETL